MSRNFELLSQIESDCRGSDSRTVDMVSHTSSKVPFPNHVSDAFGDEMVKLVQRIFLSTNGGAPRSVVFCGIDGENGSGSVCTQAGRALASYSSLSVCLVDANIRSPRISKVLSADASATVFAPPDSPSKHCEQISGNLWLARRDLLVDALGSLLPVEDLKRRLSDLRAVFDYVLINAPGTSVSGDPTILGQAADATVLVVEANSTRRLSARKAKEAFDAVGIRLLGTVLHNRSFPIPDGLYKKL